jgi:hypothetical protein
MITQKNQARAGLIEGFVCTAADVAAPLQRA